MTALAQGANVTLTVGDGGTVTIATNGGFGSVIATPNVGPVVTDSFGPGVYRRVYGPFAEGASVVVSNATCAALDYDYQRGGGMDAATQALVSGAGNVALLVDATASASAAATNAAAIQAAMDAVSSANGRATVRLVSAGLVVYVSQTLRIGDGVTLDLGGLELKAWGAIGNVVTTKAFQSMVSAPVSVTLTWSSGLSVSVAWTAHGRAVGDWVWLNRADQGQFSGVFYVQSVTDANNFVVTLRRLPTTSPTGTVVACVANRRVKLVNGVINWNNSGGNNGAGYTLHAAILAGAYDVEARDISGRDTSKFVLCFGGVAKYRATNVGGDKLNSDTVKVYGPAFGGEVYGVGAGNGGDDYTSAQTREPAAYVAYDFCQGDVLGLTVVNAGGSTATADLILYASPYGVIDGVTFISSTTNPGAGIACRIETLWATGGEVGTVTVKDIVSGGQNHVVSLGQSTNPITVRKLVLDQPVARSSGNNGRLVYILGTAVTANIEVRGGYIDALDNVVNAGSNTTPVSVTLNGTVVNSCWNAFNVGTSGTLNLALRDVVFSANPGNKFINTSAGTSVINLQASGVTIPAAPALNLGAGTSLRLSGPCSLQLDGTLLDATVANHAAGASFYNTNAGFGTGVGAYIRGSTTWTRVAA